MLWIQVCFRPNLRPGMSLKPGRDALERSQRSFEELRRDQNAGRKGGLFRHFCPLGTNSFDGCRQRP